MQNDLESQLAHCAELTSRLIDICEEGYTRKAVRIALISMLAGFLTDEEKPIARREMDLALCMSQFTH